MDSNVFSLMTSSQRVWLLRNPSFHEAFRKKRADLRWSLLLWWSRMWVRIKWMFDPLPTPSLSQFPTVLLRLASLSQLRRGTAHYMSILEWVKYLAGVRPDLVRKFLVYVPPTDDRGIWCSDIVKVLAEVGRVGLVGERLKVFMKHSTTSLQQIKIWKWLNEDAFAVPHIAKILIRLAADTLNSIEDKRQKNLLTRKLMSSHVVLTTLPSIGSWFSRRLPEEVLLHWCLNKRHPKIALAMRNTPRGSQIMRIAQFKAIVHIAYFFYKHVHPAKPKMVRRDDCAICWNTKILWSLHGERRHGVCSRCLKGLFKNGIRACPVCRAKLA